MEGLIKFYDKMVADTMAYMVVHANNRNEGRNVVYVDIEDEESLFFFHCAMNVASAYGKVPVYVDSSFANYIRILRKNQIFMVGRHRNTRCYPIKIYACTHTRDFIKNFSKSQISQ